MNAKEKHDARMIELVKAQRLGNQGTVDSITAKIRKAGRIPPKLERAVNPAEGQEKHPKPVAPVEPAKPSTELINSTIRPFARRMATAWESFHSACKTIYRDCLEAWETVTHTPAKRTRESVNAFHKALKPILTAESGMEDGTIRNLLAKCRKENGLPDGMTPERKKQLAAAKAKKAAEKAALKAAMEDAAGGGKVAPGKADPGSDVISITIASKTSSFALSADGEEVDNSVEGLYAILVKLQKVYGETLLEAVNKLMELDPAVNE